ncbi:MAG TPA: hypothetical protein VFI91_07665 [Longimicrobiaceae bacterium]|nr:hypothetical protein [Longimicrobiaceae bacterium]
MKSSRELGAAKVGYFQTHLREAIEINKERLPRYAALTGGESVPISRSLIRTEYLTLPMARYVDWRAARFQASGIRIVRDEFVSMSETPPFREMIESPPRLADFSRRSGARIARRIRAATRADGFPGAAEALQSDINAIADSPYFHCMLRHLLESALRIARLAPRHVAQATELDVQSPAKLSRLLLRLHLAGLGAASRMDARAAPLQARGVPIIYQDVPPIQTAP